MGFRINTNIAALQAHTSSVMNNKSLDNSLARLSSGLRINKAADDASGMSIADSLRSQAQGLGQAINNANDGVAVVQTADGALDEYIGIINTVRTKSIQAASDGQNSDSRAAIQADIDRLLEAANSIANTTQFNGQKLLDGTFTNKAFHIGAYAGETVSLSAGNVQTNAVGDIKGISGNATRTALATSTNVTEGDSGYTLNANSLTINGTDVSDSLNTLSPLRLTDAASVASAVTDATGLVASGTNLLTAVGDVAAGSIDSTNMLKINGIAVADTTVVANDADGALRRAINDISSQTGVTAELDANNKLALTSNDGSNIAITTSSAQPAIAQVDSTTLTGAITAGSITATVDGTALATTNFATDHVTTMTNLATTIQGASSVATATYTAATNTTVGSTGTFDATDTLTWTDGTDTYTGTAANNGEDIDATMSDLVANINLGSSYSATYNSATDTLVITDKANGEVVNGTFTANDISGNGTATMTTGTQTATADSLVVTGAADGTAFTLSLDDSSATGLTASAAVTTVGQAEITSANASSTVTGLTTDNLTDQTATVSTLTAAATANVVIAKGDLIINGTDMAGTYGDNSTAGSAASAFLAKVQSIDGMEDSTLDSVGSLKLVVNNGDDLNVSGVTANSTFGLTKGVTNDSQAGTVKIYSEDNVKVGGDLPGAFGLTSGNYAATSNDVSLESIDVTTRESAEVAILISDSALKQLDSTRSDLGSVQNQLESTIRNISVTSVNVTAAESQIRDVDFASESANFSKFNILAQSGSYAMSQANAVQQNVLRLLQ